MTPTYSLILPAACRPLSPAEADAVLGGADTATDDSSSVSYTHLTLPTILLV